MKEPPVRIRNGVFRGVGDLPEHYRKLFYSACYFAVSFIILSYTGYAWSTSNAWDFGFNPRFSYDGMVPLTSTRGWNVHRIAWVYLASPIWGLLVFILCAIGFYAVAGKHAHTRTILFWFSINGFVLYFSFIISGLMSGQDYQSTLFTGFVAFYSWQLWSEAKIYGVLIVQTIFSLVIPLIFSRPILQLNYSRTLASNKKKGKQAIFLNIFLIPASLGMLIVALATFPMDIKYQAIKMGSLALIGLVAFLGLNLHKAKHIQILKGGLKPVPLAGLVVLIALILASRFWLQVKVEPFW